MGTPPLRQPPALRLLSNVWLCRPEGARLEPRFADLFLADGRIVEVRPADPRAFAALRRAGGRRRAAGAGQRRTRGAEDTFDAEGRVATPALANFHEHLYSRLSKGWDPGRPTDSFQRVLENLWWRLDRALDPDMVEACARLGAVEAIHAGVTTVFDHHSSPGCTAGSLSRIAGALAEAGLRGVLCFETSDRYGEVGVRAALAENRRFLEQTRGSAGAGSGDFQGLLGLHAAFTLGEGTLQAAAALRAELGCGIHIHLAEDRLDRELCLQRHGQTPAARLARHGLLTPDSILAHAVHLDDGDRALLAESGAAVAFNPDSNLNNAVGLPAYAALPPGVPLLCGTDGMHASPGRSLKQLFLLARHQGLDTGESFRLARKTFFDQAAFLGRFFPGADRADLVVWEYRPPTPFTADTFWGHYLYGVLESAPALVLQGGRPLLREGRVLCLDEAAVAASAARQGERLFERLAEANRG